MDESRVVIEKTADGKSLLPQTQFSLGYHSYNYCHFFGRLKRENAQCHTLLEVVYFKCMRT